MTRAPVYLLTGVVAACAGDGSYTPMGGSSVPTPPELVSTVPEDGATEVAPSSDLRLVFSEPMSPHAGVVLIEPGDTVTVLDGAFDDTGTRWAARDFTPFAAGEPITVTVRDFTNDSGTVMAPVTLTFFTRSAPDTTLPRVIASSPEDGALAVPPNLQFIRLTFSEAMDEGEGRVGLSAGGMVLGVRFTSPDVAEIEVTDIRRGTAYEMTMDGFFDLAGNPLDRMAYFDDGKLDFVTAYAPDETRPWVLSSDPAEGAQDVFEGKTSVTVTFSEPMDAGSGSGVLSNPIGSVQIAPTWSPDRTVARFEVTLAADTDYALALLGFGDEAHNRLDGTPYLGDGRLDFRVPGDEDLTPPYVRFSLPPEGSTDVPAGLTAIVIAFDEPMRPEPTQLVLEDLTDTSTRALEGTWSDGDRTLTLPLVDALMKNHTYRVELIGFEDVAGNALGETELGDRALDFTTEAGDL